MSKVSGVTAVSVDFDRGIVRFKVDACCTPVQTILKAVAAAGNFRGELAYELPKLSKAQLSSLTTKLETVQGIQKIRALEKDELLLVAIDPKGKTMLRDIDTASKSIGVTLAPPSHKTTQ